MKVVFDLGRPYMKYAKAVKNLPKVLGVEPSQISTALSGVCGAGSVIGSSLSSCVRDDHEVKKGTLAKI